MASVPAADECAVQSEQALHDGDDGEGQQDQHGRDRRDHRVVRELDVDVKVASRDGPAHTAQDLVEGVDRVETCPEITTCYQNVIDLLDQLLLSLLLHVRDLARVLSLEHLCLLLCVSYLL